MMEPVARWAERIGNRLVEYISSDCSFIYSFIHYYLLIFSLARSLAHSFSNSWEDSYPCVRISNSNNQGFGSPTIPSPKPKFSWCCRPFNPNYRGSVSQSTNRTVSINTLLLSAHAPLKDKTILLHPFVLQVSIGRTPERNGRQSSRSSIL